MPEPPDRLHTPSPFESTKPTPADFLDAVRVSELRLTHGQRGNPSELPSTVDIRYSGVCQLRCAYCWGPAHDRRGSFNEANVTTLLQGLAAAGVKGVVHSGGETTLAPVLPHALATARSLGLRSTLSTNGIGFAKHVELLPLIDDLGIAIDGDTAEVHNQMRRGAERHDGFAEALRAVALAQTAARDSSGPRELTVRTVVAKRNVGSIVNLPDTLKNAGVDLSSVRLKMYQVEPFGPHFPLIDFEGDWAVNGDDVLAVAERMRRRHAGLNLEVQLYSGTVGRYFLIGPDGDASGTDEDVRGRPIEVNYGNVLVDLTGALAAYRRHGRHLRKRRVTDGASQLEGSAPQIHSTQQVSR
jgi:Fe-coproporphyrin III synthase